MTKSNEDKFRQYWQQTIIIREYQRLLFTFGDMELPYVFVAENTTLPDRTVIQKGTMVLEKPHIFLPTHQDTPKFEGFEHSNAFAREVAYLFRAAKLPYSHISNKPLAQEKLEYGCSDDVIERICKQMDVLDDTETGLIKGPLEGIDISLIRYSFGLAVKSAPENINEFLEHLRSQSGKPIKPNEKITEEELRKLFE